MNVSPGSRWLILGGIGSAAAFSAASLLIGIFYLAGVRKFLQADKAASRN